MNSTRWASRASGSRSVRACTTLGDGGTGMMRYAVGPCCLTVIPRLRLAAGSFAFLRLLVSSGVRGWAEGLNAIRSFLSSLVSLLRGKGDEATAAEAASKADGKVRSSKRGVEKKYQARGRNPLASPLTYLMRSASKGARAVDASKQHQQAPASPRRHHSRDRRAQGQGAMAARLLRDQECEQDENAAAAGGSFRARCSSRHSHATSEHSGHETELGRDTLDLCNSDRDDEPVRACDTSTCLRAPAWREDEDPDAAGVSGEHAATATLRMLAWGHVGGAPSPQDLGDAADGMGIDVDGVDEGARHSDRHSCYRHSNLGVAEAACAQFEGVEPQSLADEGRQIKMSCSQLSPASTLLVC